MNMCPSLMDNVESTNNYEYTFTLSDYVVYLKNKKKPYGFGFTDSTDEDLLIRLEKILKGNRIVFSNWIPAPENNLIAVERRMIYVIKFLSERTNREKIIALLKTNTNVIVNYGSNHMIESIHTEPITFDIKCDNVISDLETKPVTQVSTYWLFGIVPIWIRSKKAS